MSDPIRDCPHGHKKGKCDTCDVIIAERTIATLEQRVAELQAAYELMTSTATSWFDEKEVAEAKVAELEAAQTWVPVRLYNAGYAAGHDDTVEACYTDVADCDKDTYHADIVAELLEHYLSAQPSGEGVEPLGAEFESVWNANAAKLYEP